MAITIQCVCGKRTVVSDALAGKVVRCPACGDAVVVTGSAVISTGSAPAAGKARGKTQQRSPAIDLSRGQIVGLFLIGGLLLLGGIFYFGPMRVWREWGALEPKASGTVQDLIVFSLKQHMKEEDLDTMARRRQPSVERHDVSFFQPIIAMTMPDKIAFIGKSNQGTFSGHYDTRTGEMDATVSYGGYSVAGMVDVMKPAGTFHLVGRMLDRKPEMEIDGKKIQWN